MISFFKRKGFKPSIIPGRSYLQTNFVVTNMGHLSATLIYFIQSLAAIKAWPRMYTDGQLNPLYASLVSKDVDIIQTMRQLDAMGIDCRAIIKCIAERLSQASEKYGTPIDLTRVKQLINEQLAKINLTLEDIPEMMEDSGLDLQQFFVDLVIYLNEQPEEETEQVGSEEPANEAETVAAPARKASRLFNLLDNMQTPADQYEQELRDWLHVNGVKL
jgi:hypothetical protein